MKIYTVHKPPVPSQDTLDQVDELVFIKEGFCWLGFLIPPIWMAFNRMWAEALAYIAIITLLTGLISSMGLDDQYVFFLSMLSSFIIGFEGHNLLRWKYDRADYKMIGTISGANLDECELKFLSEWAPEDFDTMTAETLIPGTPTGTAQLSELNAQRGV